MSQALDENVVRVDCRGVKLDRQLIEATVDGQRFQFILSDELREKSTFHAGLYVNLKAVDDTALIYPKDQRFCALLESPINVCYDHIQILAKRFRLVFTHQESLICKGKPFYRLMFGTNWVGVRSENDSATVMKIHPEKSHDISFMGSIQHPDTKAYSFRREIAELCVKHPRIASFGKGIHAVGSKREALSQYRFSIAMENAASNFYFSEKLVDCLLLETVPIYFGCPGIGSLLDINGILTFNSKSELEAIIERANSATYASMRDAIMQNKKTVIERGWHSHDALFHRIAKSLPKDLVERPAVSVKNSLRTRFRVKVNSLLGRLV